jgi:hypothetical protein
VFPEQIPDGSVVAFGFRREEHVDLAQGKPEAAECLDGDAPRDLDARVIAVPGAEIF